MNIWSKALEVFFTGIVGVYLVMLLLQILTQLGTAAIDRFEAWNKGTAPADSTAAKGVVSKERLGNPPC